MDLPKSHPWFDLLPELSLAEAMCAVGASPHNVAQMTGLWRGRLQELLGGAEPHHQEQLAIRTALGRFFDRGLGGIVQQQARDAIFVHRDAGFHLARAALLGDRDALDRFQDATALLLSAAAARVRAVERERDEQLAQLAPGI